MVIKPKSSFHTKYRRPAPNLRLQAGPIRQSLATMVSNSTKRMTHETYIRTMVRVAAAMAIVATMTASRIGLLPANLEDEDAIQPMASES